MIRIRFDRQNRAVGWQSSSSLYSPDIANKWINANKKHKKRKISAKNKAARDKSMQSLKGSF